MENRFTLQFHGRLRDFLAREHVKGATLSPSTASIKDVIESLGVPHPEIGLILIDGQPVDFTYQPRSGETIKVFPAFDTPATAGNPLPALSMPPAFLCDIHLGALARYLRMLGFDTRYQHPDPGDEWLAVTAAEEGRVLLTRDLGLLKRAVVTFGYFPRQTNPKLQLREVTGQFGLKPYFKLFTRCADCNTTLLSIDRQRIFDRLPEKVAAHYDTFSHCSQCDKIFWMGSHYDRMREMIGRL